MPTLCRLRACLVALILAACSPEPPMAMDQGLTIPAQHAYGLMVQGELDSLFARMDKGLDTPEQRQMVRQMRQVIPAGASEPAKLIDWRASANADGSEQQVFVYRYRYGVTNIAASTAFVRAGPASPWRMLGISVYPASPEEATASYIGAMGEAPPLKYSE